MAVNTEKNSASVAPLPPGGSDKNYNCYGACPVPEIETEIILCSLESFGDKLGKEEGDSRGELRLV